MMRRLPMMRRWISVLGIAALPVLPVTAQAEEFVIFDDVEESIEMVDQSDVTPAERLLIVNGNTGHVLYDDGRNDLFCVIRRVVVDYNQLGRPIRKPVMRCR